MKVKKRKNRKKSIYIFSRINKIPQIERLKFRAMFIMYGFFFLFFLVIARAFILQILEHDFLLSKAQAQHMGRVLRYFDRGTIYFKNGKDNIAVATIKKEYEFAINPMRVKSPKSLLQKIKQIVKVDEKNFLKSAYKKNDPYEVIKKSVPEDIALKLKDIKSDAIVLVPVRKRYYPAKELAAHTIGFVGYSENGGLSGKYGLEKYWDEVLSRDQDAVKKNFFTYLLTGIKEKSKGNLICSIDVTVQKYVEDVLQKLLKKYGAEFAGAIIMDPKTGQVISMAQVPSFDLNNFSKYKVSIFKNKLVQDTYEMGSIVKPLTVSAGLDAGVIGRYTKYNDKGFVIIDSHKISNYDGRGRGPETTVQQVINESLNTGTVFVMKKLGRDLFRSYFYDFGLAEETGIDLPYEALNLTDNLQSPREIEYATASFGQGIALTPISMTRAFGAVATGYLVTPNVCQKLDIGIVKKDISDKSKKKVLKASTVETISRMLVENVDEHIGGGKYKLKGYSVAAKTGTAQVPNPKGGYYKDKVLHTFAGYFPAYDPKFVIFIMLMDPKGVRYSSETLPRPFFKIVKFLINYYNIPPDRE